MIERLRALCTVIELRSFSRAAEILGITQPAVSQQIKSLEKSYGTRLLHREGSQVVPTEAGIVVHEHALQILRLLERSKQQLHEMDEHISGELHIGSCTGLGEGVMPHAMVAFQQRLPDTFVHLQVGDSSEIIDRIIQHRIDLGFVGSRRQDQHLQTDLIISDELVLVVAANHSLAQYQSIDRDTFCKMPLVLQQMGSGATRALFGALRPLGIGPDDLNVVLEAGLQESTKNAVLIGYGGTVISRFGVSDELRSGSLVAIPIQEMDLQQDFYVAYRKSWPLSRLAQAFLQEVRETAAHFNTQPLSRYN